ncbi:hypothetical protein JEQ12_019819 [Ovis aries]|uniref:60S ribosomal protein L27 n=1 Tax=Ovis aries TaxID=9940 RepID=A0A835ZQT6_SHEEP|nr:hypothetical protein JEQ12_019819 [Ovis aries]
MGLVLAGCYSGHGTSDRPYSHALVSGTDCYPCKVSWARRKSPRGQRSSILCIFPWTKLVNKVVFRDPTRKCKDRYKTGKNKWFFQKLRF